MHGSIWPPAIPHNGGVVEPGGAAVESKQAGPRADAASSPSLEPTGDTRCFVAIHAWYRRRSMRLLLPLLLVPSVAWADAPPPPGGFPAETCILDRVKRPGEDCYTCDGNLDQLDNHCLSPKPGYTERCATRRQGVTWTEVWCNGALDAATPPPAKPDAAPLPEPEAPPPEKTRDRGCHVAVAGTSGDAIPWLLLLGLVGLLRR
jgi:MYXO-CTERM domain-containing protein